MFHSLKKNEEDPIKNIQELQISYQLVRKLFDQRVWFQSQVLKHCLQSCQRNEKKRALRTGWTETLSSGFEAVHTPIPEFL